MSDAIIPEITIKYSFIEEKDVPDRPTANHAGYWTLLFESIPEGKAAVIPRTEKSPKAIYASFYQWRSRKIRKEGFFCYKLRNDKKNTYIIHSRTEAVSDVQTRVTTSTEKGESK